MRWVCLVNNSQNVCFEVTPESAKTQSWVTKTVQQQIPGRRARNSKTLTTITVHCPVDTAERPSSADWLAADYVDDWRRRLFVCNFPSYTAELSCSMKISEYIRLNQLGTQGSFFKDEDSNIAQNSWTVYMKYEYM